MAAPSEPPSPAPAPPSGRGRWQLAAGQLEAGSALLLDTAVEVRLALPHLEAAWAGLAATALAVSADAGHDATVTEDPTSVIQRSAPHWLTAAARQAAGALAAAGSDPAVEVDGRAGWILHARGLAEAFSLAEHELWGDELRAQHRRAWTRRIALGFVALLPVAVWTVLSPPEFREGAWAGAYYDNPDFEGTPQRRRDGDIHFQWDDTAPMSDMPDDGFTARWDTCMTLDETHDMRFRLVSNDGSRLWVDGELLVDNWGRHGERARGGRKDLEPGVHHLRVEFLEVSGPASLSLVVSLQGERPQSLPTRLLTYPGDDFDEADPCGHLR
jgi:hypothetical protein